MVKSLRQGFSHWGAVLAPLLVLLAALGLRAVDPAILADLRVRIFDQYQVLKPRPYDPQWHRQIDTLGVAIVDIDEESLTRYGQWPWSRDLLARLLGRLYQGGAAAVAFDMVFAEPDRTSLDQVLPRLETISQYDALRAQFAQLQALDPSLTSNDRFFADTLAQLPTVVLGFSFSQRAGERVPAQKKGIVYAGSHPFATLWSYPGATPNLVELETAAAGLGSFSVVPDNDGVVRRVPIVFALGESADQALLYPSLVAEVLRLVQGENQSLRIKSADASGEGFFGDGVAPLVRARIGEIDIPTDAQGQVTLWDSGSRAERYVPAWKILDDAIAPDLLEGRILLVGTSAPGLQDLKTTPLEKGVPGVEVHAQIAEQILGRSYLNRPDYATRVELGYMVLLGVLLIAAIRRSNAVWGALLGVLAMTAAVFASWYAYDRLQLLFDPVYPSLAALAVYLVASLINFARSEADKRQVRGAFSRYLSPALVEQLAQHPETLRLGGEMREMTLLFSDIRGFTTFSEQFDPPGLTRFINGFLTPMTEVILAHRGTIDKYIGDCIMAFWNAPLDVPDHAAAGCRAALRMFERLQQLNEQLRVEADREQRPFEPIRIGAGLNSGPCCVGNMGSELRFDYSVLGDTVNLASRLEGQSKYYGVDIVIGDNTEVAIRGQFATLELDLVKVKGKQQPVRVHTVLGEAARLNSPAFVAQAARHRAMLEAYRAQRWCECDAACDELAAALPEIAGLYALYRQRVAEFRAMPPAADWIGIYTATSK